ncbi:phage tail length tape measure family protein [Pantoea osteomyelitidis]|uniref:Phage tail length tape measure family protein n=1 Tax=Pantoea osteomyelitidis TaxID=3230026 RepID=A0ABW7PV99_9GAMM
MSEQESRLAIIIDSTGAEKNADSLTVALNKMTQAGQESVASTQQLTKATEEEKQALAKLRTVIDPVGTAIDNVGRKYTELKKYFDKGLIDKEEFNFLSQKLNETTAELSGVAKAERDAAKAHEEQRASLQRLIAQLDPVGESFRRIEQQQTKLANAKASGMLSPEMYDTLSGKLAEMRSQLEKTNQQIAKGAISSGQYKNALRQLPAQITDVVTSVAGGMPLWTVFMQQGGQIADSFGGWGSLLSIIKTELLGMTSANDEAADSLSGSANSLAENVENGKKLLGFLTPARLALGGTAAAAAALAVAYYQGSKQQTEFAKSLALTGNLLGTTTGQLADMAEKLAKATGATTSDAANVLNQLVGSGKVAKESLGAAAEAILNLNEAAGISVEKLVADFNAIAEDPVASISKLNDQYHFLTLSVYEQVKALQEQGREEDAARIASEAFSTAINQRSAEIQGSLGLLERAWKAVADTAKSAWDSMLDIGREGTIQDRINFLQNSIDQLNSNSRPGIFGLGSAGDVGGRDKQLSQLKEELQNLKAEAATQDVLNTAISDYQKQQDKAIKTQQEADRVNQQYLTNAQKRAKAIKQQNDFLKAGAVTQQQYASNLARINEMYKDPKQPKGRVYTEDAGARLLDQIKQQTAALQAQYVASQKLSSAAQQRIRFEQQIADMRTKTHLTSSQKSLLLHSDEIVSAYKAQEALSDQMKTLDDYQKLQDKVKDKEQRSNNLLKERLDLLARVKAIGQVSDTDIAATRASVLDNTPVQLPSDVTRVTGSLMPSGGELSGSWSGVNQQLQQIRQAKQALDEWQNNQLAAYQQMDLTTSEYEQKMYETRKTYATQYSLLNAQASQIQTSAMQSMMDSMVTITKSGFEEQSGIYKAMFAVNKAFAIAQSLISIQQGIAMAAANPFPYNLAAMASVAAATASIVTNISAIAGVGFEKGGYTGNIDTKSVAGVVHGKEFVFDATSTKKIGVSNLENLRRNGLDATLSRPGFGTGAQNISGDNVTSEQNFHFTGAPITINGNPSDTTLALVRQAQIDGAMQGYQMVADHLASGRGKVSKALSSGWATRRRAS